jgi:hypothetical protein
MTGLSGITRVAAAAFIALALASCAMNAQQQPEQAPPQKQSEQGRSAAQIAGDSAVQPFFQNSQADPNLPGLESPVDLPLKVSWNYGGGNIAYPQLRVNDPGRPTLHGVQYYGWNEEGSLLRGDDGKVYVWKLKENSLTERYKSLDAVPTSVLASLKNSVSKHEYLESRQAKPASKPEQPVPSRTSNQGNISDDDARKALGGLSAGQAAQHPSGVPGGYSATVASLKGDMLTLTLADGSRKALKVERPPTPTGAAATMSGDIAGMWLSFDANKVVVIRSDGTATVANMDPSLRAGFEQIKKMRDQR